MSDTSPAPGKPKDNPGTPNASGSQPSPDLSGPQGPETPAEHEMAEKLRAKVAKETSINLPTLERGGWWVLVGALAVISVAWSKTFAEMWLRWFPAWEYEGLSLSDRLTKGDSYYSHGPLVLITNVVIAYFIYRRVGFPVKRTRGASVAGWTLMAVFLTFHLLSVYAQVMFISGFALIGVIGGMILVWGGWPLARAYALPVILFVFMVPLPEMLIVDLNFRLKFLAGSSAVWATNNLFGVAALMDGSYVFLPAGEDGVPKMLVVENVCSGLRSLISLIWFASLFAMVCRTKGVWRLLMLVMAVPVAVLCNVVRITSLNLMAHYVSLEVSGPGGWWHDISGILVFAFALGVLFGIERLIMWLSTALKRDWTDQRLLGFLDKLQGLAAVRRSGLGLVPVVVLVLVAVPSVAWGWGSTATQNMSNVAGRNVPKQITVDGQVFTGTDHVLDDLTLIILETNDYLYRRFQGDRGDRFDLLIVFSANNRKGTHPPEVCIEGDGTQIVHKETAVVGVQGMGDMRMREIIGQKGFRSSYFLYTYKSGDKYTPSFFGQQFWIFFNGLASRNTAGALVRFSTLADPDEPLASREFVAAAVGVLLPEIDRGLP